MQESGQANFAGPGTARRQACDNPAAGGRTPTYGLPLESYSHPPPPGDRPVGSRIPDAIGRGLVSFEVFLYVAVALLLAVAAAFVLAGTISSLVHAIRRGDGAVEIAVVVLDRILLTLIVAELVYTLRFVLRTHEIVVEPFLFIGLIAVVRRILIVTAEFERSPLAGRALTNMLLELGLLGLLVPALAGAVWLVRRSERPRDDARPATA